MAKFSPKYIFFIVALVIIFVLTKVILTDNLEKETGHKTAEIETTCDIRTACQLPNGVVIKARGKISDKTPFTVEAQNVPEGTEKIYISFSMEEMDMGFNRFKMLKQPESNTWIATKIRLPLCIIDSKDYLMTITIDKDIYDIPFQTD